MKLPALPLGRDRHAGACRQCNIINYIVPLDPPTYKGGGKEHAPVKHGNEISQIRFHSSVFPLDSHDSWLRLNREE